MNLYKKRYDINGNPVLVYSGHGISAGTYLAIMAIIGGLVLAGMFF